MRLPTYPFPRLVVQRASDINGTGHVFDGERPSEISSCYLVTYSGSCKRHETNFTPERFQRTRVWGHWLFEELKLGEKVDFF